MYVCIIIHLYIYVNCIHIIQTYDIISKIICTYVNWLEAQAKGEGAKTSWAGKGRRRKVWWKSSVRNWEIQSGEQVWWCWWCWWWQRGKDVFRDWALTKLLEGSSYLWSFRWLRCTLAAVGIILASHHQLHLFRDPVGGLWGALGGCSWRVLDGYCGHHPHVELSPSLSLGDLSLPAFQCCRSLGWSLHISCSRDLNLDPSCQNMGMKFNKYFVY